MVTVKIYGASWSPYTQSVMMVCHELGIEYEIIPIDLIKGEQKSPEFVEKQPFGSVPVFVDEDGTQLFESRAICRYLVAKYGKGSGLVPNLNDFKAQGLFEQAASIEYSSFDPQARALTFQRVFAKLVNMEPDEGIAQKCVDTLKSKMEGYEKILSTQKYLAGDEFTLADLFHLPYGKYVHDIDPSILGSKPNVKRWWDDINARPSWKALSVS